MSEDSFIARWSRLKQQAVDERKKAEAGAEADDRRPPAAGREHAAEARAGHVSGKAAEADAPFDPASLPPIESIVAGTDIRAFLQKGVPTALTKAALRRAWVTDPAIRDFIEMAENQWDFTDPTAIPGFGPLQASDDLRQLVGQALGNLPEAPRDPGAPDPAGVSQERPDAVAKSAADASPHPAGGAPPSSGPPPAESSALRTQVVVPRDGTDNPDTAGVAALQHREPPHPLGNAPRRKAHGRAMPS
jgi:hypothetical protein